MYIVLGKEPGYPNSIIMPRTSDPNIQIDPNLGKSNQIKSNQYLLISNQIKLNLQFDLIYLMTSLRTPSQINAWRISEIFFSKIEPRVFLLYWH